ncbi:hypothetical protein [Citrobacter sp.]|uniref:hypothetical protein n=1 Tax=Citrobacter sp. TaxID=1896336 RepID=UPI002FCB0D40
MSESREMPKYKSHKEVWALKIAAITPQFERNDNPLGILPTGIVVTPAEEGYAPFFVEQQWADKFKPQVGGYIVTYKDGYTSYSPADAFEDGYSLIEKE